MSSPILHLQGTFPGISFGRATSEAEVAVDALTSGLPLGTGHRDAIAAVAEVRSPDERFPALRRCRPGVRPIADNAGSSNLLRHDKSYRTKVLADSPPRTRSGGAPTAAEIRAFEKQWFFDLRHRAVLPGPVVPRLLPLARSDALKDPWREKYISTGANMFPASIPNHASLAACNAVKSSRVLINNSGDIA